MSAGDRTMGGALVRALSDIAPSVSRGRTALDVVRIAAESVAPLELHFVALQLVENELFVLVSNGVAQERRPRDRWLLASTFSPRAPEQNAEYIARIFADGKSVYQRDLDLATFLGPSARCRTNGVATPVFVRGLPWGILLATSPTLTREDAAAVTLFNAQVSGALALADCTQALAHAEEERVSRERLASIGELAATLAHEVRNPLGVLYNAIASLKHLLRRDLDPKSRSTAQRMIGICSEETERLDAIVNDMLTLARPTVLRTEETEIHSLVGAIANVVPDLASGSAIDVRLDLPQDLPTVMIDDRLVHQALLNVVINAVQAMPRGGRLTLRAGLEFAQSRAFASIDVIDTGPGIPVEHQPRLFEPFFTTKPNGTGLGLPLVKRIIDAHGGEIEVLSSPEGTTFRIRLPLPSEEYSHVTLTRDVRPSARLRVVGSAS
jgi:signal transduction histidine kinase